MGGEVNDTIYTGELNNVTAASSDDSVTPERLSVSISISFSTSKSNRNDSSSLEGDVSVYPKANATCEEIQNLIQHLKNVKEEDWKDKVLGHVRESSNFSSANRTEDGVVLVYPVNGHRRSNDKADIDVSIVYPMNSICTQINEQPGEIKVFPEDVAKNSSETSNTSQVLAPSLENKSENSTTEAPNAIAPFPSSVETNNSSDLQSENKFEMDTMSVMSEIRGFLNVSETQNVTKINELGEMARYNGVDPETDFGVNSTDSELDDPAKNLTIAEEPTDGTKRNTSQDDLNSFLQSRRMLFGQRIRQKPAQKVLNTTQTPLQRNRTRLVDLFSKYSRQSPLGRSSRFQSSNTKANSTSAKNLTIEDGPQNANDVVVPFRTESQLFELESGNGAEKTAEESRIHRYFASQQNESSQLIKSNSSEKVNTTAIEFRNISQAEHSSHGTTMFVGYEKLLSPDEEIEEEIGHVGSKIDHKQRSRSVVIGRGRGRKYNHFPRNYKLEEKKEVDNGTLSIMNGGNKNSSTLNISLLQTKTNKSSVNVRNGHENKTSRKEGFISNVRNFDHRKTFRLVPNDRESRNQRGQVDNGRKVLVSTQRVVPKNSVTDVEEDLKNKTSGSNERVSLLESSTPSFRGTKSSERINSGGHSRVRVVKRLRVKSGKTRNNAIDETPNAVKIIPQNSSTLEGPSGKEKEARGHVEKNRTWTNRGVETYKLSKTRLFFPPRSKPNKKDEHVDPPQLPVEHHSKTLDATISEETWEPITAVHRDGRETFKTPTTMETGFRPMESSRDEDGVWQKRKKIAEMELRNPLVFQLPTELENEQQHTILVSTLTAAGQDRRPVSKAVNVPTLNTILHQNNDKNQHKSSGSAELLKSNNKLQPIQLLQNTKEQEQTGSPFTVKQPLFQGKPNSVNVLHDDSGKLLNHLKELEDAVQDVCKLQQLHQSLTPSSTNLSVEPPLRVENQQPQNWSQQWLEGFPKAQQQLRPGGHSLRPSVHFRASPPDPTQSYKQQRPPALMQQDPGPQQGQIFREADEEERFIARMQQLLPPPLPFFRDSPSQFASEFMPVPQEHPDPDQQYWYHQLQKYHQQQVQYYQGLRQFLTSFPGLNNETSR